MAYSSGFLNKRVTVLRKVTPTQAGFGSTTEYRPPSTYGRTSRG